MGSAALVTREIELGRQMVDQLDETKLRPKIAVWMTTPEYEEGRLVLAASEYDRMEPLKAYEAIGRTLVKSLPYGRPAILLLKMRDPLIKALRDRFAKASSNEGMLLGGHQIGNRFIEDAYVYRIT